MKKILFSLSVIVAVFIGQTTFASYYDPNFTLRNDSQCVGGTLVLEYADVADTGAAIAAKEQAIQDCQWLMTGPGQCCAVKYRKGTPPPPGIGSHFWSYSIYEGATVGPANPPTTAVNNQTGGTNFFQNWAGIAGGNSCSGTYELDYTDLSDMSCPVADPDRAGAYSAVPTCQPKTGVEGRACTGPCKINTLTQMSGCVIQTEVYRCVGSSGQVVGGSCTTAPTPVTVSLVANPNAIVRGGSSLLTWSSTGAVSCSGNFPTGGATQGSVAVSPTATIEYSVTCTGSGNLSGNYWTETGYLPNPPHKCVSQTCPSTVGTAPDPVSCSTSGATCQICDGAPVGDANSVVSLYECRAGGAGNSATAKATVSVVAPQNPEFTVSCRAHPSQVAIGEDVLWSSTVTGGEGSYTYRWSGTDGLSGSGNQVFKQYGSQGSKTASLQVTFKPSSGSTKASCPVVSPPECSNGTLVSRGTDANGCSLGFDCQANSTSSNPPQVLPPGTACPAIGWMMPTTPCSGTWSPTYDTGGCQSGWQCVGSTGNGDGAMLAPESSSGGGIVDTIINFFQFDTSFDTSVPEIQDVNRDPGAFWFSPKVAHAAQCPAGQTPVPKFNPAGSSCAGGTVVHRSSETLDAVMIGDGLDFAQMCEGAQEGDCCEVYMRSSTSYGGGFPANSFIQVRVVRGGVPSAIEAEGMGNSLCVRRSQEFQCSSVAGFIGTQCTGGGACTPVTNQDKWYTGGTIVPLASEGTLSPIECAGLARDAGYTHWNRSVENRCPGVGYPCEYDPSRTFCAGVNNPGPLVAKPPTNQTSGNPLGGYPTRFDSGNVCSGATSGGGGSITKTVQCDNAVQVGAAQCSDGVDNDGDGTVDEGDSGCNGGEDDGGVGEYDPNDNSEGGSDATSGTQCSDGIDNNGDGNVDYPDDPGCSSADDNLEVSDPADLSLSVNPPLIKKNQQCTITFSARSVTSCSLTGSGISNTYSATNGFVSTKEVVTPGLQQTATYTLSCRGLDGKTATKKVDCKIAPTFEEI